MGNHAMMNRLAALGAREARLMRKLQEVQAERCELLCAGFTANAAALGLDPGIDPTVIEPKDGDGK